jgi:hypothetical protein
MGNINCCEKVKINESIFHLENIFHSEDIKINQKENQNLNILANSSESKTDTNKVPENSYVTNNTEFDYTSNLRNNSNAIQNYMEEKNTLKSLNNWMKLIRHFTFENKLPSFNLKFLEELNKARTDFLGISQKLLKYSEEFDIVKEKFYEINNDEIRQNFFRTKDDLIKSAEFFKKLYVNKIEKNEENLEEFIEIDEIKLPIPSDKDLLNSLKYYKLFKKRFDKMFSKKFALTKINYDIFHEDPEISYILFISKNTENLSYLFEKKSKYIGIDFIKDTQNTYLMTIVTATD